MRSRDQILDLVKRRGLVRPVEMEALGIPREYVLRLYRKGELMRVGRGLYALPNTLASEFSTFSEVGKRYPHAVICLLSALPFHNLTTQMPRDVWVALESGRRAPMIQYPLLTIVHASGESFHFGIQEHKINRVPVRIYSPAKTVADCFKFRRKVGLDVALEALRETWRSRKATMDELWRAAKVCRVANVMKPYMESLE